MSPSSINLIGLNPKKLFTLNSIVGNHLCLDDVTILMIKLIESPSMKFYTTFWKKYLSLAITTK
ncbi:hypothetical protein BLOT_005773 [Blomia tropicalis]|nr:hypothetical protein BLOT_005773 [Blomia tropicalis]